MKVVTGANPKPKKKRDAMGMVWKKLPCGNTAPCGQCLG